MSRRLLRKSSIRNSPKVTPSPRGEKSTHADAFLFDVEPIDISFPHKSQSDNEKLGNEKLVMSKIKRKQKKVQSPLLLSLQVDNEEEKISKKVNQKKKIRNTQELNIRAGDGRYSEADIKKVKTKVTKKTKAQIFLSPIDMLEEDKNPFSGASAYNSTDSENKENETNAERCTKPRRGQSRKTRKPASAKTNSDTFHELGDQQKPYPLLSSENCTTDSDGKGEEIGGKERRQMTGKVSKCSRRLIQKDLKAPPFDNDDVFVLQDSTIGTTLADSAAKFSSKHLETEDTVSVESARKKPILKREGTFEISSRDPVKMFSEDFNKSHSTVQCTRDTYCVVPQIKPDNPKVSKKISIPSPFVETIDLTESLREEDKITNRKLKLSTDESSRSEEENNESVNKKSIGNGTTKSSPSVKESLDNRKSSFEISFNINKKKSQHDLLNNLNITRRDSRNSGSKKTSRSIKYSNGDEAEDTKGNFVTIRRQNHTMIDFGSTDASDDSPLGINVGLKKYENFEKLNEEELIEKNVCHVPKQTRASSRRTGILKKSSGDEHLNPRRDTFELLENHFDIVSNTSMSTITEGTPRKEGQTCPHSDIFDMVSKTPTAVLGDMMIESGESLLLNNSFANQTNAPRLTKMGTFTANEETLDVSQYEGRKSTRKRWSQVEKVSILDYSAPNEDSKDFNVTKTKSVTFCVSPLESKLCPVRNTTKKRKEKKLTRKSVKIDNSQINNTTQNTSKLKTVSFLLSPDEKKPKGKKSVKIESPLTTPKIKHHSPLVLRKTPLPHKTKSKNDSILAGNCAFSKTPPTAESTPYPKKKEVGLLKKVLTNEKSKGEKSIKCSSSRVKMPNFQKIHERQFEKMENIKELQERKAARAQFLLSGHKLVPNTHTSNDIEKESRKKLHFSPLETKTTKISKPLQHMLNKRASLEKKKKALNSKVPVLISQHNPSDKNHLTNSQKSDLPNVISGRTRLGFKLPLNATSTKEAQIKAIVGKSKLAVDRKDQSRKQQVMVRTNRRFELLMQMRANKK